MRVLLTGGGSGGHVFPLIAVGRELKKLGEEQGEDIQLSYMGPADFLKDVWAMEHIHASFVSAGKWRRYASMDNVTDLFKIPMSVFQALWSMFWIMPDIIFSKGGYGSLPALWASRLYRIPVFMHDSDSVPGVVSSYAARFARRIFTSFEGAATYLPGKEVQCVGTPVRKELLACSAESGRTMLRIQFAKPVIFIIGGSQGAQKINELIVNTLPHLLERYEVIHQCGLQERDDILELTKKEYKEELLKGYHLYGLMTEEEMCAALGACDLVVSRAGSTSIYEIAQSGKPSVIIPIAESVNNHQFDNAHAYGKGGACIVMDEQNLAPNLFMETVNAIMSDAVRQQSMCEAARAFAKPEAAAVIAKELFDYVRRR